MNLQDPHCQGDFNVISSYILSLELSDLKEGDGEGDQRLCLRKAGWSGGTALGAMGSGPLEMQKKGEKIGVLVG